MYIIKAWNQCRVYGGASPCLKKKDKIVFFAYGGIIIDGHPLF